MKKLILEFDDFHPNPEVNCLSEVKKLVADFPTVKLNMFTVAKYNGKPLSLYTEWCDEVRGLIESGNLILAIHGLTHRALEFKHLTKHQAKSDILEAESILKDANLPFVKVFRGPYWGINGASIEALVELEYTHLYSHRDYLDLTNQYADQIKVVIYNWNLKDSFGIFENETESDIIVGHGHTHSPCCGNGIQEANRNLRAGLSKNLETLGVDEY